ncbi:hypothetical protein HY630_01995 [Candidatus Uhrbacteria bacterium]|nr:hypothetical protein [Candidatus Uhrbacteria bacterium]
MSPRTVRVSIRPQLEGLQRRREIKHDLDFAREHGIAIVRLEPRGPEVPAAVTLRTMLRDPVKGQPNTDTWEVLIAPQNEGMLIRLLAHRANLTTMRPEDVPIPADLDVRYEIVDRLQQGHVRLSSLGPPRSGTFVEMTLGITRDLVRIAGITRSSSTEMLRRERGLAKYYNEQARLAYQASHWPFRGPVSLLGLRYPRIPVPEPEIRTLPEIPRGKDPWEFGGELWEQLVEVGAAHFAEVMESLWKAAFTTPPFIQAQLLADGYQLDRIDSTRMGVESLTELMRGYRGGDRLTMVAAPDLPERHLVDITAMGR